MSLKNAEIGDYVEVTDRYRTMMLPEITWGNGFGIVTGLPELPNGSQAYTLKWADGFTSSMHSYHLQESTRKAFFKASLSC